MSNNNLKTTRIGKLSIVSAHRSDIGKKRSNNEDSVRISDFPDQSGLIAVVADGMGGHVGGETASGIVVDTITSINKMDRIPADFEGRYKTLLDKFYEANDAIQKMADEDLNLYDMGSTGVVAWIADEKCLHIYSGDSRLYHFRDNEQIYVTADHSVIHVLLAIGKITKDQVKFHPMKGVLTSCIGGGKESRLKVDPSWNLEGEIQPSFLELKDKDILLLCTDGFYGEVEEEKIYELVKTNSESPDQLVDACIKAALESGGKDNVTVAVLRVVKDDVGF